MENKLFCEYRFKFYLNASHSVIINGRQGEAHPHTWEFTLDIMVPRDAFEEFSAYERKMTQFFDKFQNQVVNDIPPFETVIPTLENMVEQFGDSLRSIIQEIGGELISIEGSETPTRSYVISYDHTDKYLSNVDEDSKEALSRMVGRMLDDILL